MAASQLFRHNTAQKINFIRRSRGDHQVAFSHAGRALHHRGCAVSMNHLNIHHLLGFLQHHFIAVYYHNVMVFPGQLLR